MKTKTWKYILGAGLLAVFAVALFGLFAETQRAEVSGETDDAERDMTQVTWEAAELKWEQFAREHLEKMRQAEAGGAKARRPGYVFDREFVEVRTELTAKLLPDCRLYRQQSSEGRVYSVFCLTKDGTITDIGSGRWSARKDELYYRNVKYSDFLASQRIEIANRQAAIDVVGLTADLYSWAMVSNPDDWEYQASKDDGYWLVRLRWVGDPRTSIIVPPAWEVVVDEQNRLQEVRQRRPSKF